MRTFIFSAMIEELTALLAQVDGKNEVKHNSFSFFEGKIRGRDVVLGVSGVGTVASGMFIATLNVVYKPTDEEVLINIGSAGGIAPLHVRDIVVGKRYCYGDADYRIAGPYQYGQMAGCPFMFESDMRSFSKLMKHSRILDVTIQTNDTFMTDIEYIKNLLDKFYKDQNVLAFDSESAAYAQASYKLGLRFIAIRFISDVVGAENQMTDYFTNNESDVRSSDEVLKDVILDYLTEDTNIFTNN